MAKGGSPEEELNALLPPSIAVRFDEMFPSVRARRVRRRDRKRAEMLRKAEPVLRRALGPLEIVRFVTNGARQLSWGLVTAGSMNPFYEQNDICAHRQAHPAHSYGLEAAPAIICEPTSARTHSDRDWPAQLHFHRVGTPAAHVPRSQARRGEVPHSVARVYAREGRRLAELVPPLLRRHR